MYFCTSADLIPRVLSTNQPVGQEGLSAWQNVTLLTLATRFQNVIPMRKNRQETIWVILLKKHISIFEFSTTFLCKNDVK